MRTNKFLAVGLLATMILGSCSNNEDPANTPGTNDIQLNAGIGLQTRAGEGVISPNYEQDLKVAFARVDQGASSWAGLDLKAVRLGGSGATPIAFETTQAYDVATPTNKTTLIGYYPRPENAPVAPSGTDPFNALYTIDGNTDIMATPPVSGSKNSPITTCTFNHHLAQLQFRYVGSSDAITKWQNISVKVKGVPTDLQLKINKGIDPALTVVTPGTTGDLDVVGGSKTPQSPDEANPTTGYVMLYPVTGLGTGTNALTVEVTGEYNNAPAASKTVTITNIAGGLEKGKSNLITLIFTVDGDISASATADIAPWNPGNAGSSVVTPN